MITGQGNGQGGREVGQRCNQLPGARDIEVPEDRDVVAKLVGSAGGDARRGRGGAEMVHLMAEGEISGLVVCSNLMVSLPTPPSSAGDRAARPLRGDRLLPLGDRELADVVLPGSAGRGGGDDDEPRGPGRQIRAAVEPPGEARRDWEIICDLALRLGAGRLFAFEPREIWEELRRLSKGGVADYSGITWERIEAQLGVFWPCPCEDHPGTPRLFEGRFHHPDGRARFHAVTYRPPAEDVEPSIRPSSRPAASSRSS